jgi:hypothetical protein
MQVPGSPPGYNPYPQYSGFGTAQDPTLLAFVGGGLIVVALFIANRLAFIIAACVFIYILGLGNLLFNNLNAFKTWSYWRMFSPGILAFAGPLSYSISYELRKASNVTGRGWGIFNQSIVTINYAVRTFLLIIIGAWVALCLVWYGIDDIANCGTSSRCNGGIVGKTTPVTGAIMILVAWSLAVVMIMITVVIQVYAFVASRQVALTATAQTLAGRVPIACSLCQAKNLIDAKHLKIGTPVRVSCSNCKGESTVHLQEEERERLLAPDASTTATAGGDAMFSL